MPKIAEIRRKGRTVSVAFDDGASLLCDRDFLPARRLAPGQVIETVFLERLRDQAAGHDAERQVLRWIARRPRSRAELRQRLRTRGIPQHIADETLGRLQEQGYLDDAAFAKSWVESRCRFRPRSRALIRSELRGQGVDAAIIEDATRDLDDGALALGIARGQSSRRGDWTTFEKRTGTLLIRRGFSAATTATALRAAWGAESSQPARSLDG